MSGNALTGALSGPVVEILSVGFTPTCLGSKLTKQTTQNILPIGIGFVGEIGSSRSIGNLNSFDAEVFARLNFGWDRPPTGFSRQPPKFQGGLLWGRNPFPRGFFLFFFFWREKE